MLFALGYIIYIVNYGFHLWFIILNVTLLWIIMYTYEMWLNNTEWVYLYLFLYVRIVFWLEMIELIMFRLFFKLINNMLFVNSLFLNIMELLIDLLTIVN